MTESNSSSWKCSVCGYVHQGPEPPGVCPVCGVPKNKFEPFSEPIETGAASVSSRRWKCVVCGYVHEGNEPPEVCPQCGAGADSFEPEEKAEFPEIQGGGAGKIIVVGAGIAGLSAAEALRSADPSTEILLFSKESSLPYYRVNLTRYLAGEIGDEELPIHPQHWYEENKIQLAWG